MIRIFWIVLLALCLPLAAFAESALLDGLKLGTTRYYVRLKSGDILSGTIAEFVTSEKEGDGIKLRTAIGTATIYEAQIADIYPMETAYPHSHRIFIMPTAEPIESNHFIGLYELFFLYGGFGVGNIFSVTAGRTILPTIPSSDQLSTIDVKASLYRSDNEEMPGHMAFAVGGNLAYLNAANPLVNFYGVGTFIGARARINAMLFYKASGEDIVTANAGTIGSANIKYAKGAIGVGIGLDTKLIDSRYDVNVIGELWNNDVARPTNTALLLGFRLWNTSFSADFGLAFFTQPAVAPFTSFVWTPFK